MSSKKPSLDFDAGPVGVPTTSPSGSCVCPICQSAVALVGTRPGRLDAREFTYVRCLACQLTFVRNPRMDLAAIYTEEYYRGEGADPLVDYDYELNFPEKTIRNYEWQGLVSIYRELRAGSGRWLDFGCGCGGLVAYARKRGIDIVGCDDGWGAGAGRRFGIPILTMQELQAGEEKFDFITAVEVIEHTPDPIAMLRLIASRLRPGGTFFLTTGNAEPWRERFLRWGYLAAPEVHITFYEPETLRIALRKAGLEPCDGSMLTGYTDIIKYKVLKILHVRNRHRIIDALPWRWVAAIVDGRHQVTHQPYAVLSACG